MHSMKKLIFCLPLLLITTVYAQRNSLGQLRPANEHRSEPKTVESEFLKQSSIVAYSYNNVRDLAEINDAFEADAYPWISGDGLRLYYTHSTPNNNELRFTQRPNIQSNFGASVPLTIAVVDPVSMWLSADELDAYVSDGYVLYYAHRNTTASAFAAPTTITLTGFTPDFFTGASLNAAQTELFLFADIGGLYQMFRFVRTAPTSFALSQTFVFPPGYLASPGQLSKDELVYFMSTSYNLGPNRLFQMTRPTPTDSFLINTFEEIIGVNDTLVWNSQPTMSDSLDILVFSRTITDDWTGNNLYIADKNVVTAVFDEAQDPAGMAIFPNPSQGNFTIRLTQQDVLAETATLQIWDAQGKNLVRQQFASELRVTDFPQGIYFAKVSTAAHTYSKKFVVR